VLAETEKDSASVTWTSATHDEVNRHSPVHLRLATELGHNQMFSR